MHHEPRFTLKAMFLSVACFAFAIFLLTVVVKCFSREEFGPETSDYMKLLVLACGPLIGITNGAGFGLLLGNLRKHVTDGAIVGFLLAVIMLIRWAFPF
jgi:hypothetical protein